MRLLKLLARLPLPVLHGLGVGLGWLIYWAPGRHSGRMRDNLLDSGLCTAGADCRRLLRQAIGESGKGIIELLAVWLRPYDKVLKLVKGTSGWEQIDAARAVGKGVIVIAPHIGCFEMINQYYAARHPFTAMYKPPRQAFLDQLMLTGRRRGQATLVPTDLSGVRALLAALKRHEAIGILPDQVATGGDGVWAPFFGRPAYTPTLVASLQRKTGAAGFFVAAERLSWGRGYHLHVTPLGETLPEDKAVAAARINQGVEDVVRRFPAQYLWNYNRHKRPGGVAHPDDPPEA
ncbi:MAG TPA: lysophospholipid acyltransferase family protein [Thiobacillus sp.]|nr:MAG: lipid A biosynthesis lauroyl acyltransferase [Hydrogenophilales bacterium 16-64-40]OZA35665.1 MAG: lipid A biosynthesis lauroyl acyltransferase [Hydrogenophilales bacterium 17-64-65]HQS82331.1 lysophospholipid acyltransferase family protein [Thiobacillus sp.]HQT34111.1 lysophospholipid acyltransferase family protein [Thiobacillus sp.]